MNNRLGEDGEDATNFLEMLRALGGMRLGVSAVVGEPQGSKRHTEASEMHDDQEV